MMSKLIKEMLEEAVREKDEQAITFLTQLCLDANVKMQKVNEWIENGKKARPS